MLLFEVNCGTFRLFPTSAAPRDKPPGVRDVARITIFETVYGLTGTTVAIAGEGPGRADRSGGETLKGRVGRKATKRSARTQHSQGQLVRRLP
jgi:hypothetical protein